MDADLRDGRGGRHQSNIQPRLNVKILIGLMYITNERQAMSSRGRVTWVMVLLESQRMERMRPRPRVGFRAPEDLS
jgi:hypothetical protein